MCTAITLEEKTVDLVISALTCKMGAINANAIINGATECDRKEYSEYEKTLDLFNKAKESFSAASKMINK